MPRAARRYTVDEVLALPSDWNHYGLVHEELLVTPAPRLRHQDVAGDLYFRLRTYLRDRADVRSQPCGDRWNRGQVNQ